MEQAIDVSIVLVNWNTQDLLRDCLCSIYQETRAVPFETIVVDNNSNDGSREMIQTEFPQVKLIANQENRGFAAANNQGMRIAEGRYILLLNSDTVVCASAIDKVVKYADAHSEAAVVGCQVWESDKDIQPTCFGFPGLANLIFSVTRRMISSISILVERSIL